MLVEKTALHHPRTHFLIFIAPEHLGHHRWIGEFEDIFHPVLGGNAILIGLIYFILVCQSDAVLVGLENHLVVCIDIRYFLPFFNNHLEYIRFFDGIAHRKRAFLLCYVSVLCAVAPQVAYPIPIIITLQNVFAYNLSF